MLIDNAIKYSPENSKIKIYFEKNTIFVKDQGLGISKEDQKHIFERFYRSDKARTRGENSGHGLGLSLAKSICKKCGFLISVESEIGKGSIFKVKI